MRTPRLLVACVFCLATASLLGAQRLTDPMIASKLGITVQEVHILRGGFELSDDQMLGLSQIQLGTLLFDASHPGIDKHAEEQNFRALRMMDEHGRVPPEGLLRAMEHRRHSEVEEDLLPGQVDPSTVTPTFGDPGEGLAGIQTNGWTWLGPGNIGGRVRSILVHPTQPTILYCGGVDGGVWKSVNNGAAWFPLDDFMANLAICSLLMDPTDPNTIYAGTGETTHNADAIRGAGIFKTINGGTNWFRLPSTVGTSFQYVGRLAMDPNNNQTILAATRSGIYRSVDGGTNWSPRTASETMDVQYHPTDSTQAVASGIGNAWYSLDGGISWTLATGLPASGRVAVTYARSAPNCVYASAENSSGQIYRSINGGQTYVLINSGNSFLASQGWYDNVIWVDPTTTNVVIVGGVDLWRSTDGGQTVSRISQWQSAPASAHADHHVIVNYPNYDGTANRTVLFGDDGGVYRANDVYTVSLTSGWQSLNNNLGITQFYGAAGNSNSMVIVGGTQDNGTLRSSINPQAWTTMFGGDGGYSAADSSDPNYFYGEYVYLQIHRSSNGGNSSSYIYTGIGDAGNSSAANFIAPFILDPNNANTMLAGGSSLWRSLNVKAGTPTWTAIKPSTGSHISAIAVAPGNSDVIWVGHNNGDVFYTLNGTSATPTWTQADLGSPNLPNRFCERIAISQTSSSRVYVTFGGFNSDNVWKTSNNGATWVNISAGLPAAPVNSIVIAPTDPNTLYVGTEVGVYGSPNDGTTWSTGNDGPANVSVDELFWVGSKLVAATHGRGLFAITPALGEGSPISSNSQVTGGNGNGAVDPNECNQLNLVIQNAGGSSVTNVTGWLSINTPGITVVQGVSSYANIPPAGLATNVVPFQISSAPEFTCGTPVTATLTVAYNGTTNILTYNIAASGGGYAITQTTGVIVPGTVDAGNHGDDVVTSLTLPFGFTYYGQTFSNATLSSNGNLQFQSSDNQYNNVCLPYGGFSYAVMALWDDLRTDTAGSGIFTSVSGVAPNRIFNIEWRATYYSGGAVANFEIRLYENQSRFDIVYGTLNGNGSTVTVGAQKDSSTFLSYECNSGGLNPGMLLAFSINCTDGGGTCVTSPVAGFTASPTVGAAPLTVNFTNQSTGSTSYLWDFGDGNSSVLTNPAHVYNLAGIYNVSLAATDGTTTNTLLQPNYIQVTNAPPTIDTQPQDDLVVEGNGSGFMVLASGTPTLTYQWRFGGDPVAGATDATISITGATCANAGNYDVVITNPGGSLTSSIAVLTVIAPPLISLDPTNQSVLVGSSVQFYAAATNACGGGLSYQWQFEGGYLPGETQTAFTIPSATPAHAGSYALIAHTAAGNATSQVAVLTVMSPAALVLNPSSLQLGTILTGATAQATFVISNAGNAHLVGTATLVNGSPFAFEDPNQANWDLAAFTSTNLVIQFSPLVSGPYSNHVDFASNGGNAVGPLTGTAVDTFAPLIFLPPQVDGFFIFSFESIADKTYSIEASDDIASGNWQTEGSVPGDGTTKSVTNSLSSGNKFYRLLVQ